jgi:hypothetical protein
MTITENEPLGARVDRRLQENRTALTESERRARVREREVERTFSSIRRALRALRRAGVAK